MEDRIQALVTKHNLLPHPEGGWYVETFRSDETGEFTQGKRNLATSILFLLTDKNCSRFHSIQSDELWFFHEGNDFTVHSLNENGYMKITLGNSLSATPQALVKAKTIFGSSVENGYALVSCVVTPGFDFNDFKLYSKEELLAIHPSHETIITQLT
jgi:predicted cupin superfamily sugar epimerase